MNSRTRRAFLTVAAATLAASLARTLQAGKIPRVAFPAFAPRASIEDLIAAFERGLREHGLENGRNVIVDYRFGDGEIGKYREAVRGAVHANPDVILSGVSFNTAEILAVTRSIPIVMAVNKDVIREGFVTNFARPGGNITGLTWEMDAGGPTLKRLELLKEVTPWVTRVAILLDPPYGDPRYRDLHEEVAARLRLKLSWGDITDDFEQGLVNALRGRPEALYWLGSARQRSRHAEAVALSARHRLPASYHDPLFVQRGGLMSYSPNVLDMFRRAAGYVHKILNGARPGDLPIEQPTVFELLVNKKTAGSLGIEIPRSILLRADKIVE
jgi:putative ABC transport system substrate-binding protein